MQSTFRSAVQPLRFLRRRGWAAVRRSPEIADGRLAPAAFGVSARGARKLSAQSVRATETLRCVIQIPARAATPVAVRHRAYASASASASPGGQYRCSQRRRQIGQRKYHRRAAPDWQASSTRPLARRTLLSVLCCSASNGKTTSRTSSARHSCMRRNRARFSNR